jgi:hypothetical protein
VKFIDHALGYQHGGTVVVVELQGSAADVHLVDPDNLQAYRKGRDFRHYGGGLVCRSPARLTIPHDGRWHVTVDLGGRGGRVESSLTVLPWAEAA